MEEHSTDVSFSGILKTGVVLLVVAVVVHLLMWLLFDFFNAQETRVDPKPSPMFQKDQTPPEPRLQTSPPQDLQSFRASEKENLESYGWVNPEKGIVRIPVSEAMKLVIEREKASVTELPESKEQK
ncbi:hypothetical protein L0222_21625 [bacterium]|nr:hypothetical protein [bacterium]